jgi:hypothetical protein
MNKISTKSHECYMWKSLVFPRMSGSAGTVNMAFATTGGRSASWEVHMMLMTVFGYVIELMSSYPPLSVAHKVLIQFI